MFLFLFLFHFLFTKNTQASTGDQIIVTATRDAQSRENLPFSIETIPEESWEDGKALETVPGISLLSNGGPGQTKSLFMRGAKSEHLLVLVDGIIVNDPLSPSRAFDFSQLPAEEIERVEIIKGPQSVLFGSNALAGVIQIFTKRRPENAKLKSEAGSYGTWKNHFSAYGFRAGYERSDGFSAAEKRDGNVERDGYRVYRFSGVKDFTLGERTSFRNTAFYSDSTTDTDRSGGIGGDSRNTYSRTGQLQFRSEIIHLTPNEWEISLAGSANIVRREDNTSGSNFYLSHFWKAETLAKKTFNEHGFTLGTEYLQEAGRSADIPQQKSLKSYGFFAQDQWVHGNLHSNIGARIDFPSEQGNPQTYRAGIGYWLLPSFRLKGNMGTGFKAPSLYQTFSAYGSRGLAPEKNLAIDFGLEWQKESLHLETIFFQTFYKNLIEFDSVRSKYYNIGKALSKGVEFSASIERAKWQWRNSFTYTRAIDKNTQLSLLRRPKWANTLSATWNPNDLWKISTAARYVGTREDLHPTAYTRQTMPGYFVLDTSASWKINSGMQANLRLDNLLNRYYQEISGYGTAGFSAYAGLQMEL